MPMSPPHLVATISGRRYPFERFEEFAENGESLEVLLPEVAAARIRPGRFLWQRFAEFLPFKDVEEGLSLGEGNTPLVHAGGTLCAHAGVERLLLKNETQNPTGSFKDRGSLTCVCMARHTGERVTATISTGNMGHSMAAYGAHAGLRVLVFVPEFVPREKLTAMGFHGATVIRVKAPDYSVMKERILGMAADLHIRIVSGNGPVRVEGYKLTAFEMFEQLGGAVPDFIAVPTSACGHLRGIFKGYRELRAAGLIERLPRMIVVQAAKNSPIVSAIKLGRDHVIPFTDIRTVAEAMTTGNPPGGDEIIAKARHERWLAEDVAEQEILDSQRLLAASGFFVEPSSATPLAAVRKLRRAGRIGPAETVVLMLTGSGLKDMAVMRRHELPLVDSTLDCVGTDVENMLREIGGRT